MFENIMKFFKKANKREALNASSKDTAKERLHLVLMQDRANVSADFLDLMREEIIEVIKKYIDIDESAMDVRLTNQANEDGTQGAPALYANIPIINIKDETRKLSKEKKEEKTEKEEIKSEEKPEDKTKSNDKEKNIEKDKANNTKEEKNKEEKEITKKAEKENTAKKENNKKKESKE